MQPETKVMFPKEAAGNARAEKRLKAPATRKLHRGHFAYLRSLVQGIAVDQAWDRYLRLEGDRKDIRLVRRTNQWLKDEFAAAARRCKRHGIARLIHIDAQGVQDKLGALIKPLPSIDDFASERGLEDFSQEDILYAYEEEFGTSSVKPSRSAKLITEQLDAIQWLESLVAEPPRADDGVAAWMHPELARKLEAAGVETLGQLIERMNGVGHGWWRSIPSVGVTKGERIQQWLDQHAETIGARIGSHVKVARAALPANSLRTVVARATDIVPLDKFIVPTALSGVNGTYRLPQQLCLMHANNDYDAILAWLRSKHGLSSEKIRALKIRRGIDPLAGEGYLDWLQYLSNTQRAYLKEAERFLLWAVVERQKPISSMSLDDCIAYRDFLANPQPRERWCGPRGRERWGPAWRPFEGPLSTKAQSHTVKILRSMYKFLVDQCYLRGNPWGGVATPKSGGRQIDTGRSFTQAQWDFIVDRAMDLPATSANRRLQLTLRLLYATGLRLAEVLDVRVADLEWKSYPGDRHDSQAIEGWELTVVGKGEKTRIVPVPTELIKAFEHYFKERGLGESIHHVPRQAFLLGHASDLQERMPWSARARKVYDPKAGIRPNTLYSQIKRFFEECAKALQVSDPAGAERVRSASVHWLRHTHGSHMNAAGVDVKVLQQNLGHASLATTTCYSTSEDRRQMQELGKFWDWSEGGQKSRPTTVIPKVESGTQTAHLIVSIDLSPKDAMVETGSVMEDIGNWCLSGFSPSKISANLYVIAMPYTGAHNLDNSIDSILMDIQRLAVYGRCQVQCEIFEESTGRYWA